MMKHRVVGLLVGSFVLAMFAWGASPAMAVDSVTQMTAAEVAAYDDPRDDLPNRPGTYWKATYGPYNIPAAGGGSPGTHQAFHFNLPRPACAPNCRITDIIPDMVIADNNGAGTLPTNTTANLSTGLYLHHFVFYQPGVQDKTCPSGPPGSFGERFAGSGNERTHLHLPTGYGYPLSAATWSENVHFLNYNTTSKNVFVQAIIRTEPTTSTQPVFPLWLDIDGCSSSGVPGDPFVGNSEYPVPPGYSEQHQNWTSTVTGRIVGIYGHQHDLDYQQAACRPAHCSGPSGEAGGIQVSAEIVGGSSSTYYGPTPVNHVKPPDLTGATMCRSEDRYGTSYGNANGFNGHLDTMTGCGLTRDVPDGAKPEPYPAGGEFPNTGFPITAGQTIRLHGEYQNDTSPPVTVTDAMSIMQAYYAPRAQSYAEAMRVSLVPAFRQTIDAAACSARSGLNSTHGPPLAFTSCQPPAFVPGTIAHVGPKSTGYAEVVTLPSDPAAGDQADVVFQAITTDIRSGSATGPDYDPSAADTTLVTKWRISDDNNACGSPCPATVADFDMSVPVNCVATVDATIGSTCQVDTTADALNAGSIVEGKQMTVQLFRVRLNDSGTNGTRGDADDRIFEQQGIYIP